MAGHDPGRFQTISRWYIRDGLVAFVELLKEDAKVEFRLRKLAYMITGGKQPPKPPPILE